MQVKNLRELFLRDLNRLRTEIKNYPTESQLWKNTAETPNSAGSLCLHLCGNIQHFIGHLIGESKYERKREFEFSGQAVPLEKLFSEIDAAEKAVLLGFKKINVNLLDADFPVKLGENQFSFEQMLLHLYGHLNYHLGQLNYHRRLLKEF